MDSRDHPTPSTPAAAPQQPAPRAASWPYPTTPRPPAYPPAAYPQSAYPQSAHPQNAYPQAAHPGPRRHRHRRRAATAGIAAAAAVAVGAGLGIHAATTAATAPSASSPRRADTGWSGTGWSGTSHGGRTGGRGSLGGGSGGGFGTGGPGGGTATGVTTTATDGQATGVVDVDVVLGATRRGAGTGMVVTSNGEILTNRHVVEGATDVSVTVPATGRTYAARVVGISTTTDVAVVQLAGASGLATVTPASGAVGVGDAVVGVGNAGGTGGTPSAAPGTVTGVDRSITASDPDGSNPEQLTGLIETDAAIRPGDSGGPLLDTSGHVVGMDTAGSARGFDAYAVPIATALTVAGRIEAGGSGTRAGAGTAATAPARRAYLGVEVQDGDGGVAVAGVVPGSPAEAAGITAGDTITSVAGIRVAGVGDLSSVTAALTAGRPVTVTWVDADGTSGSASVTPVAAQG